jgi:hypothetical protein
MSRIIIFGDSNSYGTGLDDPATENYGYHMGKLTNIETITKAIPGSSNTRIAYEILNFKFEPSDIVLIGWTYARREMLAGKNVEVKNFGAWIDSKVDINRAWLEYFSDEQDLAIKSFMHMHHINMYLKSKNLKYIQFWFEELQETFDLKAQYDWADGVKMDFDLLSELQHVDLTHCNHPGPKSHKLAAEYIYNKFKDTFE